ncbi:hypothetical protein C0989_002418 [Termitomyces sp. Mn162]|nr:hypothetical protein C0989_002418 [Termitomyces sp. Mn162]
MAPPSTLFSIGLGTVIIFWARCYFSKKHPPLPPGPLGDPIIGNVRSIPSDDQDLFFYELGKKYVSYGHRIKDDDDPYLKVADDMCRLAVPTITPPEGTVVDILPWHPLTDALLVQHFPSWFPGTYHVNRAKEARKYVRRLYEYPYNDVKRKLADGTAKPSFLATQLEELQNGEIDAGVTIEHIQGASAITYVAGSETVCEFIRLGSI